MKVKKDQKIDFKIPEATSDTYKAEVHLVGTSIESNRIIKVHWHLENDANHNFLTGIFVEANIITDSHVAKALPSESIIVIDDISYVLVLDKKEGDMYYCKQEKVIVKDNYNGFSEIENANAFTLNTEFLIRVAFNLVGE